MADDSTFGSPSELSMHALPAPVKTVKATDVELQPGRYNANVQLILRRLADGTRNTPKEKWWWRFM